MDKTPTAAYDFLDKCDQDGLVYCHWKSNEHLREGMEGKTDVDMLVSAKDADVCRSILREQGWLFDKARPFLEMEHWVGFDDETGFLLHVHLHTAGLPVGPTKRKFFTLPQTVSDWILAGRVRQDNVWVAAPEAELFILLLRISLKSTLRNLAGAYVRKRDVIPGKNLRKELEWLLARTGQDVQLNCPALPKKFSTQLQVFLSAVADPSSRPSTYIVTMLRIRFYLIPYLVPYRLVARRKRGGKTLGSPTPVFAFIGVDGSGKSSQVAALQKWLKWKLNARTFYLGSPKKKGFGKVLHRVVKKVPTLKILFKFYAAGYRFYTARCARKEASMGRIVLTDRYPMQSLWGVTDGPRTNGFLSRLEQKIYKIAPKPGCIFVLRVSEGVLMSRDQTISIESRLKKIKGIDALNPDTSDIPMYVVDAGKNFAEVHLDCKRLIFAKLRDVQSGSS